MERASIMRCSVGDHLEEGRRDIAHSTRRKLELTCADATYPFHYALFRDIVSSRGACLPFNDGGMLRARRRV